MRISVLSTLLLALLVIIGLALGGSPRHAYSVLTRFTTPAAQAPESTTPAAAADMPLERAQATSGTTVKSDVLVLPQANPAFIGYWGGYVHTTIHSIVPGSLTGKGPDRVSVMFGRSGDAVFIASELYSSPRQHLLSAPRARMAHPLEALITYVSEDRHLLYRCSHTFVLHNNGEVQYRSRIRVYSRLDNALIGIVTQKARLRRLLTLQERRAFARPSPGQVPRRAIAAVQDFSPSRSVARTTVELPSHHAASPDDR